MPFNGKGRRCRGYIHFMGLIKDFKTYRRKKHFEETLALFGLTVEDLKSVVANKNIVLSKSMEEVTEKNEKRYQQKQTPEDDMKIYDVEIEDLHPYGKRS